MLSKNAYSLLENTIPVTIKSRLPFGIYRNEVIGDILTWDSKYIINLYHNNMIRPDKDLKDILNKTYKEIRRNNMKRVGVVFDGMKFSIDQPIGSLAMEFANIVTLSIEKDRDNDENFNIFYRNTVIARLNKVKIGTLELELEPNIYIHRNIKVFKTYNKILKTLIKNFNYFIRFVDNEWVMMQE